ncbi:hypothetical protein MRX96_036071 [Rhipicephalus microplus]
MTKGAARERLRLIRLSVGNRVRRRQRQRHCTVGCDCVLLLSSEVEESSVPMSTRFESTPRPFRVKARYRVRRSASAFFYQRPSAPGCPWESPWESELSGDLVKERKGDDAAGERW